LAPLLFCLGRALQNFLSGGESMGGAIFLLENSSEKKHDLLSSLYNASTIGGHLLASFGVYLLSKSIPMNPGWRLLYLFGCITALFGSFMRRQIYIPPTTVKLSQTLSNLGKMFWTHRAALLCIAVAAGFASATYSIALVLMNGFIPLITTLTKTEVMAVNSYLLIFDFCALPFFGYLSSKISREKVMLFASLGTTLLAIPLFRRRISSDCHWSEGLFCDCRRCLLCPFSCMGARASPSFLPLCRDLFWLRTRLSAHRRAYCCNFTLVFSENKHGFKRLLVLGCFSTSK